MTKDQKMLELEKQVEQLRTENLGLKLLCSNQRHELRTLQGVIFRRKHAYKKKIARLAGERAQPAGSNRPRITRLPDNSVRCGRCELLDDGPEWTNE